MASRVLNFTLFVSFIFPILDPFLRTNRIFPAQRNTLVLDFIKSAINIATREESSNFADFLLTDKYSKLIKSKPILNFLKLADQFIPSKSEKSEFYDLGKKLEATLDGDIVITEDGDIRFKINDEKSLKLTVSSSMVQQLSPLALYLKHLAKSGDLIIIDEPESNLHPEAQKKVVEVIAEMVNRNLWVIITTHSPFIIDYLNTLMKAYNVSNINDDTRKKVLEVIKNKDALLNPEKVSVCLFTKEGIVENAKRGDIIDLESFRKIIDEIGATFTELLIIEDIYQSEAYEDDDSIN